MSNLRPLLLGLSFVVLLGVLVWLVFGEANPPSPGIVAPTSLSLESGPETGELDGPNSSPGIGEGRLQVATGIDEPRPAAAPRIGVLSGRVLSDGSGSPLVGALVTITRRKNGEFQIPDARERDSRELLERVETDGEGRFQVSVPTAVPLDVEARADEHATARRDHLFAGDDVELRLTAAAALEGVLSRAPDGAPVVGAVVLGRDGRRTEQCRVITDDTGRFVVEDLQPGLLTVEITPRDAAAPPSKRLDLQAGQRTRLDLVLEPGVRIHGVVSDPEGQPIAGAEVGLGSSLQRSVTTDLHGWYEMYGLGGAMRRDLGSLRARADGFGGEQKRLGDAELLEDTRIDFELRKGRVATGRVLDPDGEPLEGVYVAGVGSKTVEGVSRSDWEPTTTGPDGRFELTSLHSLIDHQLFLRKEGFGTRVYDFPADEGERERIDYGDLVLCPGGRIEGVLVSRTGTPLTDHLVKLRGANGDLGRFRPDAEPLEKTWVTAVRHTRTDTRGFFHFADLPAGDLRVTATVPGKPGANAEVAVTLEEGDEVLDVELSLDMGNPISGFVITPDGTPAVGVFVQVAGEEGRPRIRATSGAGGRFELHGVTEDMGVVELFSIVASYNWYHPEAPLGVSRRVTARAGDSNVMLELRELVSLTGRVEDPDGEPLPGVEVLAYASGTPRVPPAVLTRATTDSSGSFLLELPAKGRVDLVAEAPEGGPAAPSSQPGQPAQPAQFNGAEGTGEDVEGPATESPELAVAGSVASDAQGVVLRFGQ